MLKCIVLLSCSVLYHNLPTVICHPKRRRDLGRQSATTDGKSQAAAVAAAHRLLPPRARASPPVLGQPRAQVSPRVRVPPRARGVRCCSRSQPCQGPLRQLPSMMVMVVVRTMSMAAHGGRCAVASPRAAVGSRARSRKHNSSRCHGRHHYYQFLVHVYLLFLSLSTLSKARTAEKPDKSFQKNLRTAEGAVRGVSSQTAAALRTRLRERCRRRRSMSGHGSVPMPRCEHGRLRACWRRTSSRCRPHNP